MHAYLLVNTTNNLVQREIEIKNIVGNNKIIDFEVQKVLDLKALRQFNRLKQTDRIFIKIQQFDKTSLEAQSAMLKLLEEPQANISYILVASSEDLILPTIVSRCEVIRIAGKADNKQLSDLKEFTEFLQMPRVKQMISIKDYRKREEAIEFLNGIIICGRELMIKGKMKERSLTQILITLKNIQANANSQIQLTGMVLAM